ncbi:hypothetical protein BH10PAT2_BH10PAT2_0020 [soil metagenome]
MVDTQSQSSDGTSFVTGFTVGLFVGAAGYYLFATEKGAKLRKQLVNEWDSAKVDLVEQGVIENPKVTLREFIQDMLHNAFPDVSKSTARNISNLVIEEADVLRKTATDSAKAKKGSAKKFKGV